MQHPGSACWFLETCQLPSLWEQADAFTVLDADFGPGDRFWETCHAWLKRNGDCRTLHYLACAKVKGGAPWLRTPNSPLPPPECRDLARELEEQWPPAVSGFHEFQLLNGTVRLLLAFGEGAAALKQLDACCDALFIPAGACVPASALARLSAPGATLAAASLTPQERHALEVAGFRASNSPPREGEDGPFTGHFRTLGKTRRGAAIVRPSEKSAIVLGAGLAGTAAAASLASRNWNVTLLERHERPACEASGNLAAVFSPLLSKDDGAAARLSRASFLRLVGELRALERAGHPALWRPSGVLQLAKDAKQQATFEETLQRHTYPEDYTRLLEQPEAEALLGQSLPCGGLFFPKGGWLNPPSLCAARLAAQPSVQVRFHSEAMCLEFREGLWHVLASDGTELAAAPALVLANASEAARFEQTAWLSFKRVRGQVTHLPEGILPNLNHVVCRDGYLTPPVQGSHCLGATYDFGSDETAFSAESHAANLARLPTLLPGAPALPQNTTPAGRVSFRTLTPDRLPYVGPLPDPATRAAHSNESVPRIPGLFALLGLGSRGVLWSTLAGEFLASQICGAPSPLPLDLKAAIDPARLLRRKTPGQHPPPMETH